MEKLRYYKVTNETIKLIISDYQNGESTYDLAQKYQVSAQSISNYLQRNGVLPRHRENILITKNKDEIIRLYLSGISAPKIGKIFNIGSTTIFYNLKNWKVKIRKDKTIIHSKYKINQDFFKIIDKEEKAYFLGWLWSDGSVNKENVSLSIQEKDKEILEILNKLIYSDRKLTFVPKIKEKGSNRQDQYKINTKFKFLILI